MELFQNEQQWPTLTSSSRMKQSDDSDARVPTTDWEILDDDTIPIIVPGTELPVGTPSPPSDFVVVEEEEESNTEEIKSLYQQHVSQPSNTNRKQLRHCVSSPILSGRNGEANTARHVTTTDTLVKKTNLLEDLDDSFSLVSDVASVWTVTSTAKSTLTVSFRDAILLSSPNTEDTTSSYRTAVTFGVQKAVTTTTTTLLHSPPNRQPQKQRSRIQPKIVVVESPSTASKNRIRRCSKSTGDLLGMTISDEFDMDHASSSTTAPICTDRCYEDEEVYYHRKAMGATSRLNGLKLRPDEAQRKEMILNKKDRQRQLSAMNGKNGKAAAIRKAS